MNLVSQSLPIHVVGVSSRNNAMAHEVWVLIKPGARMRPGGPMLLSAIAGGRYRRASPLLLCDRRCTATSPFLDHTPRRIHCDHKARTPIASTCACATATCGISNRMNLHKLRSHSPSVHFFQSQQLPFCRADSTKRDFDYPPQNPTGSAGRASARGASVSVICCENRDPPGGNSAERLRNRLAKPHARPPQRQSQARFQ